MSVCASVCVRGTQCYIDCAKRPNSRYYKSRRHSVDGVVLWAAGQTYSLPGNQESSESGFMFYYLSVGMSVSVWCDMVGLGGELGTSQSACYRPSTRKPTWLGPAAFGYFKVKCVRLSRLFIGEGVRVALPK